MSQPRFYTGSAINHRSFSTFRLSHHRSLGYRLHTNSNLEIQPQHGKTTRIQRMNQRRTRTSTSTSTRTLAFTILNSPQPDFPHSTRTSTRLFGTSESTLLQNGGGHTFYAKLLRPIRLLNTHTILQRSFKFSEIKGLLQVTSNVRTNKITHNRLEIVLGNHNRSYIGDCPPQLLQQ